MAYSTRGNCFLHCYPHPLQPAPSPLYQSLHMKNYDSMAEQNPEEPRGTLNVSKLYLAHFSELLQRNEIRKTLLFLTQQLNTVTLPSFPISQYLAVLWLCFRLLLFLDM